MSMFAWSPMEVDRAPWRGGATALHEGAESSLCTMRLGEEVFGIDTAKVREVLGRTDVSFRRAAEMSRQVRYDLRRVPLAPPYVAGILPYRGEVLTTLSLRALLHGGQERPGGCVLVLDDEGTGERFGLMVDGVNGVATVQEGDWEPNPCTVDARSRALFDGVYKISGGLIVRIDPARLSPARLMASGLFDENRTGGGT